MLGSGIWLLDTCDRGCMAQVAKSTEEYNAPQKKLQKEMADQAQQERDQWEHKRHARETIRRGRLDELRGRATEILAREVSAMLAKTDRRDFCAVYPYLTVLQERDKDAAARSTVATIKAREAKEMTKDRSGVTKKFCRCADGEVTPYSESGKTKDSCCAWSSHGPKIEEVHSPVDRADCRGLDNEVLP